MEREFVKQGYSARAQQDDFRQLMRKQLGKNFKYTLIALPIVFALIVLITAVVCKRNGTELSVAFAADAVALVIMLVILVVQFIKYQKNLKDLSKDSLDGEIRKTERFDSETNGKSRKTHYRIIFQSEDGKKIKLKDSKAAVYYYNVEKGDRVRYHPGFVYPLELFDKAKHDSNICVFCGKKNDINEDRCQICKNPMLI